jgi:hypothetical protein
MSEERTTRTTPASTAATLTFLERTCETGKVAIYALIGGPRCKTDDIGLELSTMFCGTAGTASGSEFG